MIINEGLPFVRDYIEAINTAIETHSPESKLSRIQSYWLSFVILGVLVTNTLCWARFERFSIGSYKAAAICWIFRRAKLAWDLLLFASVTKLRLFSRSSWCRSRPDKGREGANNNKRHAYCDNITDSIRHINS